MAIGEVVMEREVFLIGKGNTAEIYQWEENKILKLYYEYMPKEAANWEYEITKQLSDRFEETYQLFARKDGCQLFKGIFKDYWISFGRHKEMGTSCSSSQII
jgi:hypothetical protein